MINIPKLKGKIVEKGKNIHEISAELSMNPSTFYRKMKNDSFEIREAAKLMEILSLSREEAVAIFFSDNVA